jgi:hypothetical protein
VSIAAMRWAWSVSGISPTDKLVLLAIADHADDDGTAYPGITRIAQKTGLGTTATKRAIKRLREVHKIVDIEQRYRGEGTKGGRTSSLYRLRLGTPDDLNLLGTPDDLNRLRTPETGLRTPETRLGTRGDHREPSVEPSVETSDPSPPTPLPREGESEPPTDQDQAQDADQAAEPAPVNAEPQGDTQDASTGTGTGTEAGHPLPVSAAAAAATARPADPPPLDLTPPGQPPAEAPAADAREPSEGKGRKAKAQRPPWEPPPWLNLEAWREFEQHRRELRKPLTDRARDLNAKLLRELTQEQQQACIEASIAAGWTGLFPDRITGKGPQGRPETARDAKRRELAEEVRRGIEAARDESIQGEFIEGQFTRN